jgi:hypothetical protein
MVAMGMHVNQCKAKIETLYLGVFKVKFRFKMK